MPTHPTAIIQSLDADTLKLSIEGAEIAIKHQLAELKALLEAKQIQNVQYADKIYNIAHIDEANFGIVTSKRVFNAVLVKDLLGLIAERDNVKQFWESIPAAERAEWETVRIHLREAQGLLEESFVWIIGWELRRLFSIGSDKQKSIEVKIEEYIEHCFSTARLSLQLVNGLLISRLWDYKKAKPTLPITSEALRKYFQSSRPLKLEELRQLVVELLQVYEDNELPLPIQVAEGAAVPFPLSAAAQKAFQEAGEQLEQLEKLAEKNEGYGLAHCHSAELALAALLRSFPFLVEHQLVSMKKVEYEETRNTQPRYIKDFSILEKKEAKNLLRYLRYDDKASLTYALFFRNAQNVVNLFPFFLDFNTLTNEQDFQIYSYECRKDRSGLRYYSLKTEQEDYIHYQAREASTYEINTEEDKNTEQKSIRLDLVIKQFEDAMNCLLGTAEQFEVQRANLIDNVNF